LRHDFTDEELARVAEVMGQELHWSDAQRQEKIGTFRQQTDRLFTLSQGRSITNDTCAGLLQQGDHK